MTIPQFVTLLRRAGVAWKDDDASSMGAALAFYTFFSIAPLLIMVIAVASLILGPDAAHGQIMNQLRAVTGNAGAHAVEDLMTSANSHTRSALTALVSTVILLLGATTVFTELYRNLNRIWRSPPPAPSAPKAGGISHLLKKRILSFGMILGILFLLLVSLVVSAGLAAAGDWWTARFTGWQLVNHALTLVVSLSLYAAAFAMIYKYLPRVAITWSDVWLGATLAAVLFELGRFVIGLAGMAGLTSTLGVAGSLVILLMWVYYSAQVFLLGAEFTKVYASTRRRRSPPI
ncbi:MAG TPA: YihY/virulence factor BrkB family protein [Gemmatimonadales bacterium]|nr:YihY/virulence factor BrkB family protein [Gemmatimonadales bacterium]